MNAPDLFALHEAMKHWAYVQSQAHPLEADTWMQFPYWIEATCWMTPGVVVGWWCRWLMRGSATDTVRYHEHNKQKYMHDGARWFAAKHHVDTGELDKWEVQELPPIGAREPPAIKLTGKRQRLV